MRFTAIALGLLLLLAGFCITDCASGVSGSTVVVITGKYYVPPTMTVSYDSEGNPSFDSSPEEWHITSRDIEVAEAFDIQVQQWAFAAATNDQVATVAYRVGKWTKCKWGASYQW